MEGVNIGGSGLAGQSTFCTAVPTFFYSACCACGDDVSSPATDRIPPEVTFQASRDSQELRLSPLTSDPEGSYNSELEGLHLLQGDPSHEKTHFDLPTLEELEHAEQRTQLRRDPPERVPFPRELYLGSKEQLQQLISAQSLHNRAQRRAQRLLPKFQEELDSAPLKAPPKRVYIEHFNEEELELFFEQPFLDRAVHLTFNSCSFSPAVIQVLLEHADLSSLRTLVIKHSSLDEETLSALFTTNHALSQLEGLTISHSSLSQGALSRVVFSPFLQSLSYLDLDSCKIGALGAAWIASSASLRSLKYLFLNNNALGDEGISSLAHSEALSGLETLVASSNEISSSGCIELAKSHRLRALQILNLQHNRIGPQGGGALAASRYITNMEELNLAGNDLRAEGAAHLARSPFVEEVQYLNLALNAIGDRGLKALASSPFLSHLLTLNVAGNHIRVEGALAFAQARSLPTLKYLDLSCNEINQVGLLALKSSETLSLCELECTRQLIAGDS